MSPVRFASFQEKEMTIRSVLSSAAAATVFLASSASFAQAPPPPPALAPAAEPRVVVPDSRAWTKDQAIVNLRSSDKGMRLAALYRLFKEPGPDIQKWIAEAAQYDPEPRIRYEAVKALEARNESASLPIFMHIADTDKDDRVRTAARIASGIGGAPGPQPGAPGQPAPPPPPAAPGQPAPPPVKRFDATGNELPPGYLDGDPGGAQVGVGGSGTGAEVPWGADSEGEAIAPTKSAARTHSGFLPQLGFDGAMGSPRDTLNRTDIGLQLGLGYGRFDHAVIMTMGGTDSVINGDQARGVNRFTSTAFDMTLLGHWSPGKYFEVGLSAEVLAVEKTKHQQRWECLNLDGVWETVSVTDPPDPDSYCHGSSDVIYQDASYKGAAFGLLSLDLKSIFVQTDLARVGVVARVTFPTHTGARFDKGLGAADLYLPGGEAKTGYSTDKGSVWGFEPGVVASFAPIEHLTLYADLTFTMAFLKLDIVSTNAAGSYSQERKPLNFFFIPHFGAQYRFLDEKLGVQIAFSPVAFLGKEGGAGLAAFAIVPGVAYRFADHLDLSLTADIDAGGNAAHPFECAHLVSDTESQTSAPTTCGVGRQVGFALQARWEF
jgi:hypothetical protein